MKDKNTFQEHWSGVKNADSIPKGLKVCSNLN
jgi:hypothetical protein